MTQRRNLFATEAKNTFVQSIYALDGMVNVFKEDALSGCRLKEKLVASCYNADSASE